MQLIDLTGQEFGYLTVVRRAGSANGSATWECKCHCGHICCDKSVIVRSSDLLRRHRRGTTCCTQSNYNTINISETDARVLAYGVDCEGFISITKQRNNYSAAVGIGCTAKLIVDKAQELAGGIGCRYITDVRSNYPNWKKLYRWVVHGIQAAVVCAAIRPYLVEKEKQATNVIDFYKGGKIYPGTTVPLGIVNKRRDLYQKNRLLNHRGVEPLLHDKQVKAILNYDQSKDPRVIPQAPYAQLSLDGGHF